MSGDVGSGKSSVLHAMIGDMIYVPDDLYNDFEEEKMSEAKEKDLMNLLKARNNLLTAPIKLSG